MQQERNDTSSKEQVKVGALACLLVISFYFQTLKENKHEHKIWNQPTTMTPEVTCRSSLIKSIFMFLLTEMGENMMPGGLLTAACTSAPTAAVSKNKHTYGAVKSEKVALGG